MAQYNFNQQSSSFCLHLLIANFGTKGVVDTTVPIVMQQIKLYAKNYPQDFMGVVGFSFSKSLTKALYSRSDIPSDTTIPIISPGAVADSFTDSSNTSPNDNFYTNIYRTLAPASAISDALADFVLYHLSPMPSKTLLFEDTEETYSQSLGSQAYRKLGADNTATYTEGKPYTLDPGVNEIINKHYTQIFFSGFSDDLNSLKNKLSILQSKGRLAWDIHIIGGGGLYDLGSYTNNNYANLVFAIGGSYAQINPSFSLGSIQVLPNKNCVSQDTTSFPPNTSDFRDEFCRLFNQDGAPDRYGYSLPGTNVLLTYDAVETFLQALPQENEIDNSPLSQAINNNFPKVQFQATTGTIQFLHVDKDSITNATDKPVFIACTDSNGYTHPVGEYHFSGNYSSFEYHPSNIDSIESCIPKS